MPQMFPLLWLYLFLLTAVALYTVMSCVHFSNKKSKLFSYYNTEFKEHNWKW